MTTSQLTRLRRERDARYALISARHGVEAVERDLEYRRISYEIELLTEEAPSDDPYCAAHGNRFTPAVGCLDCIRDEPTWGAI